VPSKYFISKILQPQSLKDGFNRATHGALRMAKRRSRACPCFQYLDAFRHLFSLHSTEAYPLARALTPVGITARQTQKERLYVCHVMLSQQHRASLSYAYKGRQQREEGTAHWKKAIIHA
jgi:hypothetical protein